MATTYRIYYMERDVPGVDSQNIVQSVYGSAGGGITPGQMNETEWEETYEGRDANEALQAFFRDHAGEDGKVMIIEEDGQPYEAGDAFDFERTYVWVEDGKLMEYQGIDEATEGMVACPLCDGTGEVDEAVAEEFAAASGSSGDDE
jgi:hypothetical protein